MSKFFKALEQAERERALREARQQESLTTEVGANARPVEPPAARPVTPVVTREDTAPPATPRAATVPSMPRAVDRPPATEIRRRPEPPPTRQVGDELVEGVDEHLVSLHSPTAFEAEQYRALRHLVEHLHRSSELSMVAVSSPGDGDGKTTTALNLAGALAQAPDARVLFVDVDLRRSSALQRLGLGHTDGPGLVEAILEPGLALDDVVRRYPRFNLAVLPAGKLPANPYEVLKSPRLGVLLEEARRGYEYVVLDTPPLVAVPDCRVLEKWVDGFLLVVAANKTPRKLVEEALTILDPAKTVGLVFNSDEWPLSGYYHAYGYGHPVNGDGPGWLGRALQRVGVSRRRRNASR